MRPNPLKALALLAALGIVGTAAAQNPTVTIKFSSASVPDDWHTKAMGVFKQYVEKADPSIKVELYPASQLFKQDAELTAMQRGNLEAAYLSAQTLEPLVNEAGPLTAGYMIQNPLHLCSIWNGPYGTSLRQKISEKAGVTVLDIMYLGTRQLGLRTTKPIRTPADLAGVKLRMPNSKAWLFLGQALGANPTPLAFGEVYLALQTGTVDGQDNPLPTVKSAKFYEVLKQIVMTKHLVDGIALSVSNSMWNKLSPAQQAVLRAGARVAANYNNKNRFDEEKELVSFFKSNGLTVTTPNVAAFRQRALAAYNGSDFARDWPQGAVQQIQNAAVTANIPKDCFSYFY